MENRLFLLQVPTGLTQNILSDIDVTPEAEYSGKITLSQLNAYSGELTAEALTNFKTIKIEKDGSETYTNVAKLLLELQQGGGADDAREEAVIRIYSQQGDAEIKTTLSELSAQVRKYHDVYSPVAVDGKYELASASDYELKRWAPSQEADGSRTRFVANDGMSSDEDIHVVLNGVIVTSEDGSIIMSQNGPYAIGFEFAVAPSVGDVVEFFVNRVVGKASGPYEDAKASNEAAEFAAVEAFNTWSVERDVEIEGFVTELEALEATKATLQVQFNDAKIAEKTAGDSFSSAETVSDINTTSEVFIDAMRSTNNVYLNIIDNQASIDIIEDKIAAANESKASETSERTAANNAFNERQAQLEESIKMFGDIAAEHAAIENPSAS